MNPAAVLALQPTPYAGAPRLMPLMAREREVEVMRIVATGLVALPDWIGPIQSAILLLGPDVLLCAGDLADLDTAAWDRRRGGHRSR